jgi:hypothetical protein
MAGATAQMSLGWSWNNPDSNNGYIITQTVSRSSGLPATLTATYNCADRANRLLSVIESDSNGTAPNQAYLYDAFGNRAVRAGSWILNHPIANPTGIPTPQSDTSAPTTFPTAQFSNSRWIGSGGQHAYDASGNLPVDQTALR